MKDRTRGIKKIGLENGDIENIQKEITKLREIANKMYSDAQIVESWKDSNGKLWDIAALDKEGRLLAGLNIYLHRKN